MVRVVQVIRVVWPGGRVNRAVREQQTRQRAGQLTQMRGVVVGPQDGPAVGVPVNR